MKKYRNLFLIILFILGSKVLFNFYLTPIFYGEIKNITHTNAIDLMNIFISRSDRDLKKKLYIIGSDGGVEELKFYNKDNIKVEMTLEPLEYLFMNNGYSIVFYKDKYNWQKKGYLISHFTGKIFNLNYFGTPKNLTYYKRQLEKNKLKVDENNNIYYIKDNWLKGVVSSAIIKIHLIDNNILIEQLTTKNEYIESFEIDSKGNLIYRSHPNNDWEDVKVTFRKANGVNIKLSNNIRTYWLSHEGRFEYIKEGKIQKLDLNIDRI